MPYTIPFDFECQHFDAQCIELKFFMKEALKGNIIRHILHGGATATALDSASGMLAIAAKAAHTPETSLEEQVARLGWAATIDLRVDYLRPGKGAFFIAQAQVVRAGKRVIVIESKLLDDSGVELARGIGTYMVSRD